LTAEATPTFPLCAAAVPIAGGARRRAPANSAAESGESFPRIHTMSNPALPTRMFEA
jgi:hypothetical protein